MTHILITELCRHCPTARKDLSINTEKIVKEWIFSRKSGQYEYRVGDQNAISLPYGLNHNRETRAYSKEFFGVHNFKSSCMM